MPGFFFSEDQRDERGHICPRTAVLEDPDEFAVRSRCLPNFVSEIPWQLANKTWDVPEPLPILAVAGDAEGLPVKDRFPFFDILGRGFEGICPGPGFLDLVDGHSWFEYGFIGSKDLNAPRAERRRHKHREQEVQMH